MPDRDELDLSVLSRTPVGALAGAAAARQRGEQRTRRTRAALAGAGVLVAVVAGTAGTALSGAADRVAPAPFADRTPEPAAEDGLAVSLLDVEDVAEVRGEPWQVRSTDDLPFDPLPPGCSDPEQVFGRPAATALRFFDGPAPYTAGHALKGYAGGDEEARAAFGRLVDSLEACRGTASGTELSGGLPGSGPDRFYGSYVQAGVQVGFAVERVGAVLSGVALRAVRPEPALEELPPLADAARDAVSGGPFDAPDAPAAEAWDVRSALLSTQDAAAVEPGSWTAEPLPDGPLLAPCEGSVELPRQESVGGIRLQVLRGSGGTDVAEEVYRYGSLEQAQRALDGHASAVRGCPQEQDVDGPRVGTTMYELVEQRGDLLLVRVIDRCDTCPDATSYAAVVRVDDGVAVLRVAVGEDGDPGVGLTRRYAERARDRLSEVVR